MNPKFIGYGIRTYQIINGQRSFVLPYAVFTEGNPVEARRKALNVLREGLAANQDDPNAYIYEVALVFEEQGALHTEMIASHSYAEVLSGLESEAAFYRNHHPEVSPEVGPMDGLFTDQTIRQKFIAVAQAIGKAELPVMLTEDAKFLLETLDFNRENLNNYDTANR